MEQEKTNIPLVSVPVVTYNSAKTILETLESIKAQTYPNIELIISDDCSTDNTVEVCRKWIEQNKSRFVRTELLTVEKNTGVAGNLNRAEADKNARMEHLKKIGKHMEDALREELNGELIKINYTKEEVMEADDEQYGQDIKILQEVNGERKVIFYIEVKSKWDFNESAHMSAPQIRTACENEANYALCCVDLRPYKHEDLANLSEEIIIQQTRVKMQIGKDLNEMMKPILEADKRPEEVQVKIADGYMILQELRNENNEIIPYSIFRIGQYINN